MANWVYSGSTDDDVRQIDASDGTAGWVFTGHTGSLWAVAASPDGNWVYSGSADNDVKQIDASDGSAGWTFTGHTENVYAVAAGPNGGWVYSGSNDDTVKQIDASDGSAGWTFTGHTNFVVAVAAGPNGGWVYSGSADDDVRQIDVSNGTAGWVFTGHTGIVLSVAVSPSTTQEYFLDFQTGSGSTVIVKREGDKSVSQQTSWSPDKSVITEMIREKSSSVDTERSFFASTRRRITSLWQALVSYRFITVLLFQATSNSVASPLSRVIGLIRTRGSGSTTADSPRSISLSRTGSSVWAGIVRHGREFIFKASSSASALIEKTMETLKGSESSSFSVSRLTNLMTGFFQSSWGVDKHQGYATSKHLTTSTNMRSIRGLSRELWVSSAVLVRKKILNIFSYQDESSAETQGWKRPGIVRQVHSTYSTLMDYLRRVPAMVMGAVSSSTQSLARSLGKVQEGDNVSQLTRLFSLERVWSLYYSNSETSGWKRAEINRTVSSSTTQMIEQARSIGKRVLTAVLAIKRRARAFIGVESQPLTARITIVRKTKGRTF